MSDDLLKLADAEEQSLAAELRTNPTYQKLEAVRALIATYRSQKSRTENSSAESAPPHVAQKPWSPAEANRQSHRSRKDTQNALIANAAKAHLAKIERRLMVPDLFAAIIASGVHVGGASPQSAVSSVLSRHPDFDNVRGEGYGLKIWSQGSPARPEQESATDEAQFAAALE